MAQLRRLTGRDDRLFSVADLRALLPGTSESAFLPLLSRLVKRGELVRVCRGVYMLPDCGFRGSELLGRTAGLLRASCFNYLSLETVLSDLGIISQIPMGRITVMSSGRTNLISCGPNGQIEFIHTRKRPDRLADELSYDPRHRLWRASPALALQDMRDTRRDTGLVNWETANGLV